MSLVRFGLFLLSSFTIRRIEKNTKRKEIQRAGWKWEVRFLHEKKIEEKSQEEK
jgi:hypothetical protein